MTDETFVDELYIRAYIDQIDGYPIGHPARKHFSPIIPINNNPDGSVNREATLENYHTFTDEQKQVLLNRNE